MALPLALPLTLALELPLAVSSADWRIVECGKLNAVRICVAIVAFAVACACRDKWPLVLLVFSVYIFLVFLERHIILSVSLYCGLVPFGQQCLQCHLLHAACRMPPATASHPPIAGAAIEAASAAANWGIN